MQNWWVATYCTQSRLAIRIHAVCKKGEWFIRDALPLFEMVFKTDVLLIAGQWLHLKKKIK